MRRAAQRRMFYAGPTASPITYACVSTWERTDAGTEREREREQFQSFFFLFFGSSLSVLKIP
jgi:hypothetical protein